MGEPYADDDPTQKAHDNTRSAVNVGDDAAKLTLFAEDLSVSKETVETGRLHVAKHTLTSEAHVDEELAHEDAIVETVPKGHRIFVAPVTRVVGDTTIIPIVEEVLYTEKRLILKEEIHITRRRTTEHFHDTVDSPPSGSGGYPRAECDWKTRRCVGKHDKQTAGVIQWLSKLWLPYTTPPPTPTPPSRR